MIGIYKITNKLNNKSYIGQSIHCGKRLDEHCKGTQFIDEVMKLEGVENFTFEILKEVNKEDLSYWEDYYILKYNTMFPNGYNKKWNTTKEVRDSIVFKDNYEEVKSLNIYSDIASYPFDDIDYKIYILCCSICDTAKENRIISFDLIKDTLNIKISNTKLRKKLIVLAGLGLIDITFGSIINKKSIEIDYCRINSVNYVLLDIQHKITEPFNLKKYLNYIEKITEKQWTVYYYFLSICNNKMVYKSQINISYESKRLGIARSTFYAAIDNLAKNNLIKIYDDYYTIEIPQYNHLLSKELLNYFLNIRKEMTIDLLRTFIIIVVAHEHNEHSFTKRKLIKYLGYPDNVPEYYNKIEEYICTLEQLNLIYIDKSKEGNVYYIKDICLNQFL